MEFEVSSSIRRTVAPEVLRAVAEAMSALPYGVLRIEQPQGAPITVILSREPDREGRVAIRRDLHILIHKAESASPATRGSRAVFRRLETILRDRGDLVAIDAETFLIGGQLATLINKLDARFEQLMRVQGSAAGVILPTLLSTDWTPRLNGDVVMTCEASRISGAPRVLSHSACLPVYPVHAGATLTEPVVVTGRATCMRKEHYVSWPVLTEYNVREFVIIGEEVEVAKRATAMFTDVRLLLDAMNLPACPFAATDSFLGEASANAFQSLMGVKTELCVEGESEVGQLALASLNFHGTIFTKHWGITDATGELAASACIGVGLERAACALLHTHGPALERWPDSVREALGLEKA